MDMTMSSATPTRLEVVTSVQRRRRWTPEQKLEIVKQTNEPGSSVSMVARQFGITAAQLFQWRKAYLQGSLIAIGANETVVPAFELQEAMRRIKQLEGALGPKTLENEIQDAVDLAKAKKWIARLALKLWRTRFRMQWTWPKQKSGLRACQYCPGASSESRLLCPWRVAQPCVGRERSPVRMKRLEKVSPAQR
jgi:transposase